MNHDSPEYQQMLAELKADYIKSLGNKLDLIAQAFEDKDSAKLREHFHKLKGNGETYGFPDISVVGKLTEQLFVQSPEKGLEATPLAISLLQGIFEKEHNKKEYDFAQDPNLEQLRSFSRDPVLNFR